MRGPAGKTDKDINMHSTAHFCMAYVYRPTKVLNNVGSFIQTEEMRKTIAKLTFDMTVSTLPLANGKLKRFRRSSLFRPQSKR